MYILELIAKYIKNQKTTNQEPEVPDFLNLEYTEESSACEHVFLPIDSTKKVLACSKCGFILKIKEIPKKKNFFKQ